MLEAFLDTTRSTSSEEKLRVFCYWQQLPFPTFAQVWNSETLQLKQRNEKTYKAEICLQALRQDLPTLLDWSFTLHLLTFAEVLRPSNNPAHKNECEVLMADQSLKQAAFALGISYTSSSRLFHKLTGRARSEFEQALRLKRALHGLRSTKDTLGLVAKKAHYSNPSNLCRDMRMALGITPLSYRQRWYSLKLPLEILTIEDYLEAD